MSAIKLTVFMLGLLCAFPVLARPRNNPNQRQQLFSLETSPDRGRKAQDFGRNQSFRRDSLRHWRIDRWGSTGRWLDSDTDKRWSGGRRWKDDWEKDWDGRHDWENDKHGVWGTTGIFDNYYPYAFGPAYGSGYGTDNSFDAGYSEGFSSGRSDKSQGLLYNPRQYERQGGAEFFEGFVSGYQDGWNQ